MATNNKNDPREGVKGQKGQDKRKWEDKWARNLKKQKNRSVENKGPLPKYINYHSLIAPLDHFYAVMDKNLYRPPEPMKGDRFWRDIKRNCVFHKNVRHTMDKCVALKDEIKRLIRVGYFKEFMDKPQAVNWEEWPWRRSLEKVCKVLTIIGGLHLAKESYHARDKYANDAKPPSSTST